MLSWIRRRAQWSAAAGICLGLGFGPTAAAADTPAALSAIRLAQEGIAAAQADNPATYLEKMEAAAELRPDFPRVLEHLAAAQVAAEKPDAAIETLRRLAVLGLAPDVSVSAADEFKPLRPRKEFQELVKAFALNLQPKGSGEVAFTLRDVTGLFEGIASRPKTGEFFFGDVNGRAVWVRAKDGTLRRFAGGDELLGVFGLAVDEDNGVLWAATSAVAAMQGFSSGQEGAGALVAIDLAGGSLREVIPMPVAAGDRRPHVLSSLALATDGSVLLTDSGAPVLWRYRPGAKTLERFVESDEFLKLQGIALLPSGAAIVSDQVNGLLRVDLQTRRVQLLATPADASLVGIAGLAVTRDDRLVAIQNGVRPVRVLRLELDGTAEEVTAVRVLESGHLTLSAPSLGCIGPDGDFYLAANPGWNRFDAGDAPTAPRPIDVFRAKLPRKK